MTRMPGLAGLALAGIGGYLVGRHQDRLRASLRDLLPERRTDGARARTWEDELEYAHEYEREAAHRHDVAEGIKRRPLRERPRAVPEDADRIASQPIRRERDDHPYPTSY